jgi:hypothetical protein
VERPSPDDVVAAIHAAETEEDKLEVERRYTQDTAEEDPGEVDDADDASDGEGG